MTDGALSRGGNSVYETTVRFGDDEETLARWRRVETESRHPHQAEANAEDLSRAEVGMVAGGEFKEVV
jgi:hypothetical protein